MPITLASVPGHDGVHVATVTGEIDIATAGAVEAGLAGALRGGRAVLVDLSGVTFFDSSGLHALDTVRRLAESEGSVLVLVGATDQVVRVLTITNLLDSFELRPDLQSALSGLTAGP